MGQETKKEAAERAAGVSLSSGWAEGLIGILASETDTVTALMAEAEGKQRALVDDDLPALEEAVAREAELLREFEQQEAQRWSCLEEIEKKLADAGFVKDDGTALTLQDVADALPDEDRTRLLSQGEKLREAISRVQAVNLLNADLLRHSLTLTNYYLSLLTGDTGQTTYGQPGKKDRPSYQQGRLDARA
ncbi:MAG: flagellar protein FlgN [Firmicutes bacterium]|nr:flagellar protein FlgN [Bacillota bacterium]